MIRLALTLLAVGCVPRALVEEAKDRDNDGHVAWQLGGDDCDDGDPTVRPGLPEVCANDKDDDCDGSVDDDGVGATTWYPDADADGYAADAPFTACERPEGALADLDRGVDCDDADDDTSPAMDEICGNGVDDDCDGHTDDAGLGAPTWYPDLDQDGFAADAPVQACAQPAKHLATLGPVDCDDTLASVNPGALEHWYDGVDQDCAGDSDYDLDGDGYDAKAFGGTDCDDVRAAVNPGEDELCANGRDDDCDGATDDDGLGAVTWYPDLDQDGFATDAPVLACARPDRHLAALGTVDCNDLDSAVKPGATEVWYDGIDQDCGEDDDYDRDGDGFRAADEAVGGTDCEDAIAAVNPDADEICDNGLDDDCDGTGNGCELTGTHAVADIASSTITITNTSQGNAGDPLVADVTGDGLPDVIAGGYTNQVRVFASPISASITDQSAHLKVNAPSEPAWISQTVGDFNGDGHPDMALGRHEGRDVHVFFGPLSGTLARAESDISISTSNTQSFFGRFVLALPDFDGNGKDELLVGDDGIFSPDYRQSFYLFSTPLSSGWTPTNAVARLYGRPSFDGTGRVALVGDLGAGPRLVVTSHGDEDHFGTAAAFEPDALVGSVAIQDAVVAKGGIEGGREGDSIAVGDITGDGVGDLVVGASLWNSDQGRVYVLAGPLGEGTPKLYSSALATIDGASADDRFGAQVGVLDFDGDGWADLAVRSSNLAGRRVCVFYGPLGAGSTNGTAADLIITGLGPGQFATGDVDADGYDDIVVKGGALETLHVIRGAGR